MVVHGDAATIKQRSGISADYLPNVADSSELDALIQALNQQASEAVKRWCNRDFEDHASVTDLVDGNDHLNDGHGGLSLPGNPI